MATEARHVPRLNDVAARLHLTSLAATQDGDLFYLVSDPARVFLRSTSRAADKHMFLELEDDAYRALERTGDGTPNQMVVVLHNIRKASTPEASEC